MKFIWPMAGPVRSGIKVRSLVLTKLTTSEPLSIPSISGCDRRTRAAEFTSRTERSLVLSYTVMSAGSLNSPRSNALPYTAPSYESDIT